MGDTVSIGITGDYEPGRLSHDAVITALKHAADELAIELNVCWLPTESLVGPEYKEILGQFAGLWGAPGSYQSQDGAISSIQYAREMNRPFIGT